MRSKLKVLRELERDGVVREACPEPAFWRFDVIDASRLPEQLKNEYERFSEIRWYGVEVTE